MEWINTQIQYPDESNRTILVWDYDNQEPAIAIRDNNGRYIRAFTSYKITFRYWMEITSPDISDYSDSDSNAESVEL